MASGDGDRRNDAPGDGNQPNQGPSGRGPGKGGPGGGGPGNKPGAPPAPKPGRFLFVFIAISLVLILGLALAQSFSTAGERVSQAQFESLYNEGSIDKESVELQEARVVAERAGNDVDGSSERVYVQHNPRTMEETKRWLTGLTGGRFEESPGPPIWQQILLSPILIMLLFFLIIWFILLRGLRSAGGGGGMLGSFGKSRHRVLMKEMTGITFKDVAGINEAKEELEEVVEFLKNPKKFMRLGGRVPRGVLLYGQPGCGKTLLAKAIAGEADVPFFTISGSDFVEMFVGVGASRVRDLFKQAKESAPCIIFLDEIDAVGRKRGGGFSSGGNDEREQTLNAILVEMDGFESSDQVIVIASTNRPDVLDPALTRPGRFDRHVSVSMPDVKGRLEILQVHAKKVKLGPDVKLERIARGTPMFSGAELAAIMNEAAIIATMHEKDHVEHADLEEARDKVKYGRQHKSKVIEEKERIATAYHEAGHALLQALLDHADPLHKVTIIPRGQAMGATFSLPEKDRYGFGLKYIADTMRVVCGGRIAEQRKTDDVSSGAAMDIQQLTKMARAMILEWGMSERLGFVHYSTGDDERMFAEKEFSEETAKIIDEEIRRLSDEAYADAQRMLDEHWDAVVRVAEALLKHETLDAEEVHKLIRGEPLGKPTVSDLLEAEAAKLPSGDDATGDGAADKPSEGDEPGFGGLSPSPA
jgi:cell division protease FtsH